MGVFCQKDTMSLSERLILCLSLFFFSPEILIIEMKILCGAGSNKTKYLITGNKPFCLFYVFGGYLHASEKECFFGSSVVIAAGSIPEYLELVQLFRDHGFKVRESGVNVDLGEENKVFYDPMKESVFLVRGKYETSIMIPYFESHKLLGFFKTLSREYGYKTSYRVKDKYHEIIK